MFKVVFHRGDNSISFVCHLHLNICSFDSRIKHVSDVDHDTTTHFLLVFVVVLHPSFDSVADRLMEAREDALALVDLIK